MYVEELLYAGGSLSTSVSDGVSQQQQPRRKRSRRSPLATVYETTSTKTQQLASSAAKTDPSSRKRENENQEFSLSRVLYLANVSCTVTHEGGALGDGGGAWGTGFIGRGDGGGRDGGGGGGGGSPGGNGGGGVGEGGGGGDSVVEPKHSTPASSVCRQLGDEKKLHSKMESSSPLHMTLLMPTGIIGGPEPNSHLPNSHWTARLAPG